MSQPYNYKQAAVLYVDDEETARKHFSRLFEDRFRVLTAATAQEGLDLLKRNSHDIGLLLTDQRMPGEKGVWLLEKARQVEPRIIRILVTAYADMDSAIAAVNTGSIYKYITKPWGEADMENAIKRGLEFYLVQKERDELLHEKLSVIHNMMVADRMVSLGLLAAGLSHHIRNSLVAVKTFLDLAPAKLEDEKGANGGLRDPEFWKSYHENAQGQVVKINNLLRELWSASESGPSHFEDGISVEEAVRDAALRLKTDLAAKEIEVSIDFPGDLPRVQADKAKLYRLFELMLKDEAVSLPNRSQIRVSAGLASAAAEADQELEITIADNGGGLPKEALRMVFDPFSVRSDSPSEYGINLMACYFIVHHHGGRIEARSEDGAGTVFSIRLPVRQQAQPSAIDETDFLQKVRWSDELWERLLKV